MRILALRVEQPLGEFYISSLPASALAGRVNNRPRSSRSDNNEDIQRIFNEKRVKEIADFSRDPQATFPTPIILAVDSKIVTEVVDEKLNALLTETKPGAALFEIPDDGIFADVLDGQHRVLGLEISAVRDRFELPVVLMFDLSIDDKAFVFSIINSKQTPVSGSLIYDLFDLSRSRSPQKTCHYVAQSLNSDSESPFYGRLKMLGRREEHHGTSVVMLSQGSFAARLQELISKNAADDARLLKDKKSIPDDSRCPLRKYFQRGDDESILKIVRNFFLAVSQTFEPEWNDEGGRYVIRKTVGFTALVIVLRHVLEEGFIRKDLRLSFFREQMENAKVNLADLPLTSAEFPSSGAGALKLAKTLLGLQRLAYPVIEAADIDDIRLES
jgi:DGQHR domain-containing protein